VTEPDIEVRRSRKRIRTVTAFRDGDRTIVAIPARFTRAQEREWVVRMVTRLADQERRRRPSDTELATRAAELSARYLGGRAIPLSVAWSTNQGRRWGSCTPTDATIRISDRVRGMPSWVLDYVLLHELTHLLHAGHTPAFWAELEAYPRTARARGFLEGVAYTHERGGGEGDAAGDPVDAEADDAGVDEPGVDGPVVDDTGVRADDATVADREEPTTGRHVDTLFD
jgi:hypothetical protein